MQSKWMAATGCLAAALALGVTACGGDDNSGSSGSSRRQLRRPAKTRDDLLVACRCRALRASRRQALVNGAKLALEQAGGKAGDITIKYSPARRLDGPGRQLDA